MGKNFSGNNVEGKRRSADFYETPYSMTQQFLDNRSLSRSLRILEPACGNGAIAKVLRRNGFVDVTAYDLETDFLKETRTFDYIITNPPYSLTHQFVERAMEVADLGFAFLLPLSYLHGQKRYLDFYRDSQAGLKCVHVFTRYPLLGEPLREDGTYRTGMMVYAWYEFERGYRDAPTVNWIDNNRFVIGSRT